MPQGTRSHIDAAGPEIELISANNVGRPGAKKWVIIDHSLCLGLKTKTPGRKPTIARLRYFNIDPVRIHFPAAPGEPICPSQTIEAMKTYIFFQSALNFGYNSLIWHTNLAP